jgi:hypothetical protein
MEAQLSMSFYDNHFPIKIICIKYPDTINIAFYHSKNNINLPININCIKYFDKTVDYMKNLGNLITF